jgi:hypothetical protein
MNLMLHHYSYNEVDDGCVGLDRITYDMTHY